MAQKKKKRGQTSQQEREKERDEAGREGGISRVKENKVDAMIRLFYRQIQHHLVIFVRLVLDLSKVKLLYFTCQPGWCSHINGSILYPRNYYSFLKKLNYL